MANNRRLVGGITATYNFVPLSDKVFFPPWAGQISHDVPFSDGISGSIRLSLTAETPIFVRNGAPSSTDSDDRDTHFSQTTDGRYFIPATSVKGAVRSVLEILSFGKMTLDKQAMFAQREWDNPGLYPIKKPKEQEKIHCGYLRRKDADYVIEDHGKPWRISHIELDRMLNTSIFSDNFHRKPDDKLSDAKLPDDKKTACYKYDLLRDNGLYDKLVKEKHFDIKYNEKNFKYEASHSEGAEEKGRVVLTGSPDTWILPRKPNAGKFFEFVFPAENIKDYHVHAELFDYYKFIYDRPDEAGKKEWKRIRDLVEQETSTTDYPGAPVFFRLDDKGNVKDFGFALLYKLPYQRTPYDVLPTAHKGEGQDLKPDMAQCLFGFINDTKSLKGRVSFSHAFATTETANEAEKVTVTPGSPKASYYPCYVDQGKSVSGNKVSSRDSKGNPKYNSYNDGQIRGWKRYVVKNEASPGKCNKDNEKTQVSFTPLKAGAEFECDVTFFNLRPQELGALLSAITFHGTSGCRHQFGAGKPYGYGRTKVTVDSITDSDGNTLDQKLYLGCFEDTMESFFSTGWLNSTHLKELLSMADIENVKREDGDFRYMTLSVDSKGSNEFADAKKQGYYLQPFTQIVDGKSSTPTSLRHLFLAKKSQEAEAEKKKAEAKLLAKLDAIVISADSLKKAIPDLADIEKKAGPSHSDSIKSRLAQRKQEVDTIIGNLKAQAVALPPQPKRTALEGLKAVVTLANDNLPGSITLSPVAVNNLISNLPKEMTGSIVNNILFKRKRDFEKDAPAWIKQNGPITDDQARQLNEAFRAADDKTQKEFKGYDPKQTLNTAAGKPKDDPYGERIVKIIFKLD